jgi:chloramphenicol 3-O-phosphotransferase
MVIVVTGAMAAGKSTVAQLIAARLPRAVHVRGDVFRRMIVSGRVEMTPDLSQEALAQLRLRYRLSSTAADEYVDAGFTAVVQDVILGPELPRYLELLRSRPVHLVVLAPRADALAVRASARGKAGYGVWEAEELDRGLRETTPRLGLWLDTSEQTPEETVDEIFARLEEARVRE